MTITTPAAPDAARQSTPTDPRSTARRESWTVSPSGVWLVAQLELKQRVRSTKWKWALGTVAALIGGVTFLMWAATHSLGVDSSGGPGDLVFGVVVFFVLFLGLVVSPTLSATSINGDVRDGTLAPLQATGLSAADIVLGKLLASWAASLAFLAVALPFIVFAYFDGRMPALAMVTVTLVLAIELLVVCAIGLGWSALTARTPASAVLTHTTVAVLVAVLPIIFGLLSVTFTEEVTVTSSYREYVYMDDGSQPAVAEPGDPRPAGVPANAIQDEEGMYYVCRDNTYTSSQARTDQLWWLLAVNPYVIVSDSAPSPHLSDDGYFSDVGMLSGIKLAVREARVGPSNSNDTCDRQLSDEEQQRRDRIDSLPPVWPWGLAVQALLGLGAVALAVRRVSVPYGKLPTDSRVA